MLGKPKSNEKRDSSTADQSEYVIKKKSRKITMSEVAVEKPEEKKVEEKGVKETKSVEVQTD